MSVCGEEEERVGERTPDCSDDGALLVMDVNALLWTVTCEADVRRGRERTDRCGCHTT